MSAKLGTPPRKANLGPPPKPEQVSNNLTPQHKKDMPVRQLNVRVSPEKHKEIKLAALEADMSLGDYLISLHDAHMQRNGGA